MMHDLIYASIMLLFVVGLIFITAALFKKFQPTNIFNKNNLGKSKRLVLEEILILDHQNKLVLITRDGVGHLLLINKDNSIVIENRILNE